MTKNTTNYSLQWPFIPVVVVMDVIIININYHYLALFLFNIRDG